MDIVDKEKNAAPIFDFFGTPYSTPKAGSVGLKERQKGLLAGELNHLPYLLSTSVS